MKFSVGNLNFFFPIACREQQPKLTNSVGQNNLDFLRLFNMKNSDNNKNITRRNKKPQARATKQKPVRVKHRAKVLSRNICHIVRLPTKPKGNSPSFFCESPLCKKTDSSPYYIHGNTSTRLERYLCKDCGTNLYNTVTPVTEYCLTLTEIDQHKARPLVPMTDFDNKTLALLTDNCDKTIRQRIAECIKSNNLGDDYIPIAIVTVAGFKDSGYKFDMDLSDVKSVTEFKMEEDIISYLWKTKQELQYMIIDVKRTILCTVRTIKSEQ